MSDLAAAGVGYMPWCRFERLRRAVDNARKYVPWLRVAGYLKDGTDPDEYRGSQVRRAHMPLGVPATWLAAEEISRLMGELNYWPQLEDAASNLLGADLCEMLIREVETAAARWPLEDRARDVKFFRCLVCDRMTLRYHPPTFSGGDLVDSVVRCTNRDCNAVVSELMFARMALLIEAEHKAKEANKASKGAPETSLDVGK